MTDDAEDRRRTADALDAMLEQLEEAREAGELDFLDYSDRVLRALEQKAQVLHLYPPEKVEVQFVDEFSNPMAAKDVTPNPELLEAMRKVLAQKRAEDKALEKELDEL